MRIYFLQSFPRQFSGGFFQVYIAHSLSDKQVKLSSFLCIFSTSAVLLAVFSHTFNKSEYFLIYLPVNVKTLSRNCFIYLLNFYFYRLEANIRFQEERLPSKHSIHYFLLLICTENFSFRTFYLAKNYNNR